MFNKIQQRKEKKRKEKEIEIKSKEKEKEPSALEKQAQALVTLTKKLHSNLFLNQDLSNGKCSGWQDSFEKILRIDKRPYEQIVKLLEWVYDRNSWWGEHRAFRTPEKFRRKKDNSQYYDIILAQYLTRPNKTIDDIFELEGRQNE